MYTIIYTVVFTEIYLEFVHDIFQRIERKKQIKQNDHVDYNIKRSSQRTVLK